MKIKKIFTNFRVMLLILFLVFSIVAIYPKFNADGVAIRNIVKNSTASMAGLQGPDPNTRPMGREVITAINQRPIIGVDDYFAITSQFEVNDTVSIVTNHGRYDLIVLPEVEIIKLNETKEIEKEIFVNETVNDTEVEVSKLVNVTVPKTQVNVLGVQDIGIKVYDAPATNLRKGLDLQGGTRVLLKPVEDIEDEELERIIISLEQRLNVFGLSDIILKKSSDISGNKYILVEIAGANEEEVQQLLAKQGKFEAKIGNKTVFKGGKDDELGVTYVCRSGTCSGINPQHGCRMTSEGQWVCQFFFEISIKPSAAERQAEVTSKIGTHFDDDGREYLDEKIQFYLDDGLVDELNFAGDLKGREVSDISISGAGYGQTEQAAMLDAFANMKRLQTIVDTGSLSVKLDIVKTDTISPTLGEEFLKNAILIGIAALLAVAIVVFIRYRKLAVALPMVTTMTSEIVLILGFAAFLGWNLDLAAIAGIIIAVGTGVDDLIVISDETLRGESVARNWKDKIKNAFYIIFAAYLTTLAGMLPLFSAGAGLLKGFALTTILGISFGVLIARPAYAAIIEILLND